LQLELELELELLKNKEDQPAIHEGSSRDSGKTFILSSSSKTEMILSGRIHRVIMRVDDGASSNGFFMDSDQGPTMLRADLQPTDEGRILCAYPKIDVYDGKGNTRDAASFTCAAP
jgi:hypothetical protein